MHTISSDLISNLFTISQKSAQLADAVADAMSNLVLSVHQRVRQSDAFAEDMTSILYAHLSQSPKLVYKLTFAFPFAWTRIAIIRLNLIELLPEAGANALDPRSFKMSTGSFGSDDSAGSSRIYPGFLDLVISLNLSKWPSQRAAILSFLRLSLIVPCISTGKLRIDEDGWQDRVDTLIQVDTDVRQTFQLSLLDIQQQPEFAQYITYLLASLQGTNAKEIETALRSLWEQASVLPNDISKYLEQDRDALKRLVLHSSPSLSVSQAYAAYLYGLIGTNEDRNAFIVASKDQTPTKVRGALLGLGYLYARQTVVERPSADILNIMDAIPKTNSEEIIDGYLEFLSLLAMSSKTINISHEVLDFTLKLAAKSHNAHIQERAIKCLGFLSWHSGSSLEIVTALYDLAESRSLGIYFTAGEALSLLVGGSKSRLLTSFAGCFFAT